MNGWSRHFVYYGMGGMGERDCLLMGMGGFIDGYGWSRGMGGLLVIIHDSIYG